MPIALAAVARHDTRTLTAALGVFWPHHARRDWTSRKLPVRLAGTLPWVLRIELAVWVVLAVGSLLFAAVPLTIGDEADAQGAVAMASFGLLMAALCMGAIIQLRRSMSAVVTQAGITIDRPSSGLWLRKATRNSTPSGQLQNITGVEVVVANVEYNLAGIAVPVRRLALSFHGNEVRTAPGLTFSATRTGLMRAQISGNFIADCLGVPFIDASSNL